MDNKKAVNALVYDEEWSFSSILSLHNHHGVSSAREFSSVQVDFDCTYPHSDVFQNSFCSAPTQSAFTFPSGMAPTPARREGQVSLTYLSNLDNQPLCCVGFIPSESSLVHAVLVSLVCTQFPSRFRIHSRLEEVEIVRVKVGLLRRFRIARCRFDARGKRSSKARDMTHAHGRRQNAENNMKERKPFSGFKACKSGISSLSAFNYSD